MSESVWCVMPILAGPAFTEAAIGDLLAQSVPTRLLLINQGVDDAFRDRLERLAEQESARIFLWSQQPSLPSLSASWNYALDFVWATGGEVALVVNNDVRLHADTIKFLHLGLRQAQALFVSAVGVQEESQLPFGLDLGSLTASRGGPDFSCFLIAREGHEKYRFDEGFIPAFCEDLDAHRRYMLGGDGQKIFSMNLPYLHLASQTLKTLPEAEATRIRQQIASQSRAHYAAKWGGPVNAETFWYPFDDAGQADYPEPTQRQLITPTTPALFDYERTLWAPLRRE